MSEVCGADSGDGYTCTLPPSQHGLDHFNRQRTPRDWPDPERIEQHRLNAGRPIGKPRGVAKKIAVKAAAAHDKSRDIHIGPPVIGGPPATAVREWNKDVWVAQVYQTIKQFVADHPGREFTTAEDIWPLIDSPREKRAMVIPVKRAKRDGLIAEVAAKRLGSGPYLTRDGVEFGENKLVPIYRAKEANG